MSKKNDLKRLGEFLGWRYANDGEGEWWMKPVKIPAKPGIAAIACQREGFHSFDPFVNLDDAMMVANKIGYLTLDHVCLPTKEWSAIFPGSEYWFNGTIPAEAITLAALAYLDAAERK